MAFAIKRLTPPLMALISIHFYPTFFLLQLNLNCMKQILHLILVKICIIKSSYNWFKIDILRLVRPLIAISSPVQGHLNYYI